MGKKRLIVFLIFLISVYSVYARYSVSIPFAVDSGGRPVASAIVGINISEGTNCVSPFYFNKTTAQYGRGEINVTSSRFIAGRVYTMCFNSTVGSNTLRGKTRFSPGVGDINVSKWVNGSSSRFNTYQLNNGSTFDVIYGRDTTGIANNTAQGKVYINSTLVIPRRINITSGSPVIAYVSSDDRLNQTTWCDAGAFCNFTWLKANTPADFWIALGSTNTILGTKFKSMRFANNLVPNIDNAYDLGSIISGSGLYWRNISSYKYQLKNGSNFDAIYGAKAGLSNYTFDLFQFERANFTKFKSKFGTFSNNLTIGSSSVPKVFEVTPSNIFLNMTTAINSTLIARNFSLKSFNSTRIANCGLYVSAGTTRQIICDGTKDPSDGNVTTVGITNIIYNGTGIKLVQVYNGTLLKNFNNTNRGKTFFNNTVFFNGTIQVRTYTLRNGSSFDVIYGSRPDGNVTPAQLTAFVYNGTLIKVITAYNGTLAKDKNLVKNNTVQGKTYLNTSNTGLFISGNLTARRYYLTNGSVFDVIYGRDTTGTGILNNTAQGKAYINSSLYPSNIRFGTWNISLTNSYQGGELNIFANSSGFIQRSNDSEPFTRSGCFRINGANNLGANGWTIPGTVHIGSECTQGWTQAYIDINDVNQNTSQTARLMQFFWNNKGPGNGIGMSMRLDSKHVSTVLQSLSLGFTGPGAQNNIIALMSLAVPSFTTNNSLPVGKLRYIDLSNAISSSIPQIGSMVGVSMASPVTGVRLRGMAGLEMRSVATASRTQVIGLFMGRQPKTSYATMSNRSYAVMSEGSPIQLSAGTPYIYNGPFITTDNWVNLTIGNVSAFYDYNKDILVTQFAGRTSGLFNLTKMSKRQYNLSFADYLYVNDTMKIGGNATHPDLKIDKTNFTIKSFNSTAYLNCAYFKSVNDGTVKLICDGVTV